jgi:hypothetical protein
MAYIKISNEARPPRTAIGRSAVALRRLVLWPFWKMRGLRNLARWRWQQFQREQRCHWFHHWMVQRHGEAQHGCGAWSWRINGILCSVWIEPMRLKIYYEGGKKTVHHELTQFSGAQQAMNEVQTLETLSPENEDSTTSVR